MADSILAGVSVPISQFCNLNKETSHLCVTQTRSPQSSDPGFSKQTRVIVGVPCEEELKAIGGIFFFNVITPVLARELKLRKVKLPKLKQTNNKK